MGSNNFMNAMQEVSENLPIIKHLPERVDTIRLNLHDLKTRMVEDYVTDA